MTHPDKLLDCPFCGFGGCIEQSANFQSVFCGNTECHMNRMEAPTPAEWKKRADQQHKDTVHGERTPSIEDMPIPVDTTSHSLPENPWQHGDEYVEPYKPPYHEAWCGLSPDHMGNCAATLTRDISSKQSEDK